MSIMYTTNKREILFMDGQALEETVNRATKQVGHFRAIIQNEYHCKKDLPSDEEIRKHTEQARKNLEYLYQAVDKLEEWISEVNKYMFDLKIAPFVISQETIAEIIPPTFNKG